MTSFLKSIRLPFLSQHLALIIIVIFCMQQEANAQSHQSIPPDGGGIHEHVAPSEPCISAGRRAEILAQVEANIAMLKTKGKYTEPNEKMVTYLEWPLATASGAPWVNNYTIVNYVDEDPNSPDILDYNCGSRTYDTHRGHDIDAWPFPWMQVANDWNQIVAAAPGTIVNKVEDKEDDECDTGDFDSNHIVIEHADGSRALYVHLKKNSLTSKNVGETVAVGEFLGIMSSSGNSTGVHLHFEIHDSGGNVIEPSYLPGGCNIFNNETWWADQQDYWEPKINAALTHSAPPELGCPSAFEIPNLENNLNLGKQYVYAIYMKDYQASTTATLSLLRPDGTTYDTWDHTFNNTGFRGWWYWNKAINTDEPTGNWKFKVEYYGQVYEHEFTVLPHIPATFTTIGDGYWSDANKWDANGVPYYPLPADCSITVNHEMTLNRSLDLEGDLTWNAPGTTANLEQSISGTGSVNISVHVINAYTDINLTGSASLSLTSTQRTWINGGADISTENGDLTVIANSGGISGNFYGIDIIGHFSTSGTGNISLTGKGGDDSSGYQHGVYMRSGATVQSLGSGTITLNGTSGSSTGNYSKGIHLNGGGTEIQSATGAIIITGTAIGSSGSWNQGITLDGSTKIQSSDGDILVTGTSEATGGNYNYGISLYNGHIHSTGSAKITLDGTGASSSGTRSWGVGLENGSQITSVNGAVNITGSSQGMGGDRNHGIAVSGSAKIESTGTATITLNGTGATNTGGIDRGIDIFGNGIIASLDGDISLTGLATATSGNSNFGIGLYNGHIHSTGSAKITLHGTGAPSSGSHTWGIGLENGSQITSANGNISLTGTSQGMGGTDNYGIIALGGSQIKSTGTALITMIGTSGNSTGNHNRGIQLSGASTLVESANGDISMTGTSQSTGGNYAMGIGLWQSQIKSTGSATVTLNGTGGPSATGNAWGVTLEGGALITSTTGNIDITGSSSGIGGSNNFGISMISGGKATSTGSATITMTGTGGGGNGSAQGIYLNGANSGISSSGGDIFLAGTGGTAFGDYNFGFSNYNGAEVTAMGSASISIEGMAGNADGTESGGVVIVAPISSVNGDISLTGNGGTGTGSHHYGIGIYNNITCTGNGAVSLNGTRGNSSSNSIQFGNAVINAPSSMVSLHSNHGWIVSGASTTDITANSLSLSAENGNIGSDSNPITFDAATLYTDTETGNGAQYLSASNSVDVTGLSFGTGIVTTKTGTFNVSGDVVCDGTLTIGSGTTFNNNGTLMGTGTLVTNGTFNNSSGIFAPGGSPGKLSVTGDLDLGSGTYVCEIHGTGQGSTYDWLEVSGNVNLSNATLDVDWGSYTPTGGSTFTVMTFGSRTGTFSSVNIPAVNGLNFTVEYTGTAVELSAMVLPVELIRFSAEKIGPEVLLKWQTVSEINNKGYEVQRSPNGLDWEKMAFVQGHGTTYMEQTYRLTDTNPLAGINYYRLKQVDFDGQFEFSQVLNVYFETGENAPVFYPNPLHNQLNFDMEVKHETAARIIIYDLLGKQVFQKYFSLQKGANHQGIPMTYPSGIYLIRFEIEGKQWQEELVKR